MPFRAPRFALALAALAAVAALPAAAPAAGPLDPNPWLGRRVLNIGHRGGAREVPEETLFGFADAIANRGMDMLETDVYATADGHIVLMHDASLDRTTNGSGPVRDTTLAELKALDAAYWFVPGCGACHGRPASAYVYRGIATGDKAPPPGFTANDFRVATLDEVLDRFAGVPINIEIKESAPTTARPYEDALARLLGEHGRGDDTIVVSFLDNAMEAFQAAKTVHAPAVSTATGTGQSAVFWATAQGAAPGAPNPRYDALQVPPEYLGQIVLTEDFVANAHANGLAVHMWDGDNDAGWRAAIAMGIDGIMTDHPAALQAVLCELGVAYDGDADC